MRSHNLVAVTDPLGHTTTYGYDNNGNRTSVKLPGLAASTTQYNDYSEPTQTTDELGNTRTFTYDANFWPKLAQDMSASSPGPIVSFTFNANGTMATKAVGYDLANPPEAATTYTYDPYGNLASQTDALRRQTTYTYDGYGRLQTTTPPIPAGATAASVTTTNTLRRTRPSDRSACASRPQDQLRLRLQRQQELGNRPNNHTTPYNTTRLNRLTR